MSPLFGRQTERGAARVTHSMVRTRLVGQLQVPPHRVAATSIPLGRKRLPLKQDALWYKDAIIYQVHVRTFHDSNGDGIGDFPGLEQKLDYLQELGINAIWLMPFFPSPLRDDGYDIADYDSVHPSYGTLEDFRKFLTVGSRARNPGHHRNGVEPHFRSASVVSGVAKFAGQSPPRLVCVERYRHRVQGSPHHFSRYRDVQLGVGSDFESPTTGIASSVTSPI